MCVVFSVCNVRIVSAVEEWISWQRTKSLERKFWPNRTIKLDHSEGKCTTSYSYHSWRYILICISCEDTMLFVLLLNVHVSLMVHVAWYVHCFCLIHFRLYTSRRNLHVSRRLCTWTIQLRVEKQWSLVPLHRTRLTTRTRKLSMHWGTANQSIVRSTVADQS